MNLILPGSLTQLVVAIVIALAFLVAHTQFNPFLHVWDNLVGLITTTMLISMLVFSTALKMTTIIEEVKPLLSDQTVALFTFDHVAAASVMITAIFASAALAVLMAAARASAAARREADEMARSRATAQMVEHLQAELGEVQLPSQLAETKIDWDELDVGELLGEGVWGETHRADQLMPQGAAMPVAVKRLAKALLTDADAVAAFRQGCELMVCLHHPNIVMCYGGAWSAQNANVCLAAG